MRRAIFPVVLLMVISVIIAGMVIAASSGAQDPTTAMTMKPADQWTGTAGTTRPQVVEAPIIETINLTGNLGGNNRYPGVAENSKGDRLVVFRGSDNFFWYTTCKKGEAWSSPARIPKQPNISIQEKIISNVDVEADSTGRFHCTWDEPQNFAVYGSFLDGVWTTPFKQQMSGKNDMGTTVAVRSNDEVLTLNSQIIPPGYLTKNVFLYAKGKTDSQFRTPKNLTNDQEGSCQAWFAVDSKDNIWVVHKNDYQYNPNPAEDVLVILLSHWDQNNDAVDIDPMEGWQLVSTSTGWSFWPTVAVNNEGKVMTLWAFPTGGDYQARLYDPAAETLSSRIPLNTGLSMNPWCTFWSRLVAHGKDFYAAVMNSGRILFLLKFDELTFQWIQVAQITTGAVDNFDLYSGYDKMLIAWGEVNEPANVFLTTVSVDPPGLPRQALTIQTGTGGTTDPSPGVYRYDKGSSVSIRAIADAAYGFASWSGDASGTAASITITLDRDMTVKANFTTQQTLTIQAGAGGTTNPSPGTYRINTGSRVSIRAIADAAYGFTSWSGDASGNAASITITLDRDMTVKANFTPQQTLTIQAGAGGTTNPSPGTYRINKGSSVSVRAIADVGVEFTSWSGDASGTTTPVTVTMDRDMTVKANFRLRVQSPINLNVEKKVERGFFNGYYLNVLSWEANPLNVEQGVVIVAQRIFRKLRTESDTQWARLTEVAPGILTYVDRNVPKDSDYVYAVACVDATGNESLIY
ncbi:MAG: hypothetical protein Q8O91_08150 [Candidatus Aminicenantes bacterium]|nr:hypothetical protein [Candidatus Aminicenantes bacterium]